jgi:hypothetical protein
MHSKLIPVHIPQCDYEFHNQCTVKNNYVVVSYETPNLSSKYDGVSVARDRLRAESETGISQIQNQFSIPKRNKSPQKDAEALKSPINFEWEFDTLEMIAYKREHISGNALFVRLPATSAMLQRCFGILGQASITTSLTLIIFKDHL